MQGLILLPNLLDVNAPIEESLPPILNEIVPKLDGLIAENEKLGRHYLMKFTKEFRGIPIRVLSEHTTDIQELLEPLLANETWGLVSDAGMPCLADPGSKLVAKARMQGVSVHVISGPSSVLLALVLSGMPAQSFTFHGYLPRDPKGRESAIREHMKQTNHTHICIETPYRNDHLLEGFIKTLPDEAVLCAAWNLTSPDQGVEVKRVSEWKKRGIKLGKVPAVFLFRTK